MNSRERILRALQHQEADRVPIDLGGNQTGIHKNAYRSLIKHLGIADEIRIMDAVQPITLTPAVNNFVQYSNFYLYGIKNS